MSDKKHGNPLLADRRSHMNSNGFVLDTSGAGKSFNVKAEMAAIIEEQEIQPRTWVFSTHVIDERAPLFDEVVVLASGRLVAAGTADEVTAAWVRLEGDFDALVAMPHLGPVDRMGGRSSAVVAADAVPPGSHRQVHALSLGTVVTALTDTHWEGR